MRTSWLVADRLQDSAEPGGHYVMIGPVAVMSLLIGQHETERCRYLETQVPGNVVASGSV
jgi:hypothetical protein